MGMDIRKEARGVTKRGENIGEGKEVALGFLWRGEDCRDWS